MVSVVEALDETIDHAAGVDLDPLTDGELDAELVALIRLRHRLDAQIARRAHRWDTGGAWRSDGSRAPWARLSRTASIAGSTAKTILRRGAALPTMPLTTAAFAAGELGADHVDLLATAAGHGRVDLRGAGAGVR